MAKTASDRVFLRKTLNSSIARVEGLLDDLADNDDRLFISDEHELFKKLDNKQMHQLANKIRDVYVDLGFDVNIKCAYTNSNFSYLEIRW